MVVASGCARPKPAAPPPTQPPVDQTTKVCAALSQAKPLEARFVGVLPLEQGGLLAVFGGTTAGDVARVLKTLDVKPVSITSCGADSLVVFISGVSRGYMVENLERPLRSQLPSARVKESVLLLPQTAPSKPRPTSN